MNLLRPVSSWIFRRPSSSSNWLEGLRITQADIDRELLHPLAVLERPSARPANVTWLKEEIGA